MRTVIQRVRSASVMVNGEVIGAIEHGLLVFIGVGPDDTEAEARWLANRVEGIRIFTHESGKFNQWLLCGGGAWAAVSPLPPSADGAQPRPSIVQAAPPQLAITLLSR